jgi:peptidyl-tRNA hydrolase
MEEEKLYFGRGCLGAVLDDEQHGERGHRGKQELHKSLKEQSFVRRVLRAGIGQSEKETKSGAKTVGNNTHTRRNRPLMRSKPNRRELKQQTT